MPNAFATTAHLTCDGCGQSFSADLWLIVDTVERPDLLARLREQTLHDVPCPHCHQTTTLDVPLLVFRPDGRPVLTFLPRWQSDAAQNSQDARQLLGLLQAKLGAAWDAEWVAEADTLSRFDEEGQASTSVSPALPAALPPILNEIDQLTQPCDMPRRIALCRQALALVERHADPQMWAALQSELGNSLFKNPLGSRVQNLEEALAAYQQALQVMTRDAMPSDWAMTQNNLANAYSDRIRGERAENIECAIHHYKQALLVRTQEAFPVDWAMTQNNLATAYFNRIRGERTENLECAIHHCRQALTVQTREAFPVDWAMTQNNLANAYSDRIRGERAENLECAIYHYKQALLVRTQEAFPVDWAMTQNNLAIAYFNRIRGERAENLEQAILHCKQALMVRTQEAFPADWAMTQNNLAAAFHNRIRGKKEESLEYAICHYKQALMVHTQEAFPVEWAMIQNNLAIAYMDRIRGERAENLECAVYHCKQALIVRTQEAFLVEWAMTQNNLANVYQNRIQDGPAENLEIAIEIYRKVLQVISFDNMPVAWAQTTNNLATAYCNRIYGERTRNLEDAIDAYEQALEVRTREGMPADHRKTQSDLGHTWLVARRWQKAASAYQAALEVNETLYASAATPEARQSELYTISDVPTALAYALVQQHESGDTLLAEAVVTLERNRARWLAESMALRREQPVGVADSLWQHFTEASATMRILINESQLSDSTPGKRDFLTVTPLLAAVRQALEAAVEQVRAVAPEFIPQPSFAEIQGATAIDNVIVYLLTTNLGGLALIVHTEGIEPVWVDLTSSQLHEWLFDPTDQLQRSGWFGTYRTWLRQCNAVTHQAWFDQIEATARQLWDALMGPLAAALHSLPTPPQTVTLIPSGLLALLPLHAAWRPLPRPEGAPAPQTGEGTIAGDESPSPKLGEGPGMGVRYFLDDFAVAYAPSALALRHAQERLATVTTQRVLAIDEPLPVSAGPLPNSSREVAAIVDHFAQPMILAHEAATRPAVLAALADGVDVAHFSCHGGNDWDNPLETALYMAHNDRLTVRDLLELHLPGARLASLSACETGLVGTELPDEVVMLPSALLQAGFAGVAASLWSVADMSTAMLMARFYDLWQGVGPEQKIAPVQALRQAQQWVRDTTNREKAAYFATHVPEMQPSGATKMTSGVAAEFFSAALLHDDGPEARTFAHPFWWAAFTFTGV